MLGSFKKLTNPYRWKNFPIAEGFRGRERKKITNQLTTTLPAAINNTFVIAQRLKRERGAGVLNHTDITIKDTDKVIYVVIYLIE